MDDTAVARHKTALYRYDYSRPIRLALEADLITKATTVFDYGCGRGDDVKRLRRHGIDCNGWDPVHEPEKPLVPAQVVNLGYVVNVIEDEVERADVLGKAWALAERLLIVSALVEGDGETEHLTPFKDGFLTAANTFQKYFQQSELRDWIGEILEASPVPASPGVYYVFRHEEDRQSFLASRYRRAGAVPRERRSDVLFRQHRRLFQALMDFYASRGRLPVPQEYPQARSLKENVGSIQRAFSIVRKVTDASQWDSIAAERKEDLLLYVALVRFDGRPKFSDLPFVMQQDVKAHLSNYKKACEVADQFLLSLGNQDAIDQACRESPIGKLTPNALYVHLSALPQLSVLLRAYEGCARGYIGVVEDANIIKLHRGQPKISYLEYPEFDTDPHPALARSLSVNLQTFKVKRRRYDGSNNPPILHRKEAFVPDGHPGREVWAALTLEEEALGLYEDTSTIGTRIGWESAKAANRSKPPRTS